MNFSRAAVKINFIKKSKCTNANYIIIIINHPIQNVPFKKNYVLWLEFFMNLFFFL